MARVLQARGEEVNALLRPVHETDVDVTEVVLSKFAGQPFEHWAKILNAGDVTFGIVGQIYDHLADDQIEANGLFPEIIDGDGLRTVDSPFLIHGEPKSPPRMAPAIGQHTRDLLSEFGVSPEQIEALVAE